jgi:hypothetical protein
MCIRCGMSHKRKDILQLSAGFQSLPTQVLNHSVSQTGYLADTIGEMTCKTQTKWMTDALVLYGDAFWFLNLRGTCGMHFRAGYRTNTKNTTARPILAGLGQTARATKLSG